MVIAIFFIVGLVLALVPMIVTSYKMTKKIEELKGDKDDQMAGWM